MRRQVSTTVTILILAAVALLLVAGCGEKAQRPARTEPVATTQPHSTSPSVEAAATVAVFFMKGETIFQVSRQVEAPGARQALDELLKGPSETEKKQGVTTAIPSGTRLNSYSVESGMAYADFSAELRDYGGGSAAVQAITNQIENTVKSNDPGISTVRISVEGVSSDEALQP